MRCWLLQTQISPQENFVLRSWNFSRDYCGNPKLGGAEMWELCERHQLLSETQRSTIIRILLITLFIFSSLSTLHKLYNCASNLLLHKFLMMRFLLHRTFITRSAFIQKKNFAHANAFRDDGYSCLNGCGRLLLLMAAIWHASHQQGDAVAWGVTKIMWESWEVTFTHIWYHRLSLGISN